MVRTWREMITRALATVNETWDDVESIVVQYDPWPSDTEEDIAINENRLLDAQRYFGYGGTSDVKFTVWTATRVYFPATYDGAEWCAWVSRNPDGHAQSPIGG